MQDLEPIFPVCSVMRVPWSHRLRSSHGSWACAELTDTPSPPGAASLDTGPPDNQCVAVSCSFSFPPMRIEPVQRRDRWCHQLPERVLTHPKHMSAGRELAVRLSHTALYLGHTISPVRCTIQAHGRMVPFKKTVPHVRHISITVVSSGFSCSSRSVPASSRGNVCHTHQGLSILWGETVRVGASPQRMEIHIRYVLDEFPH